MDSDKFQELVLQQLKTLTEGQARVEGRLDKLEGRMGDIEGSLGQLELRLDKLELRLENEAFNMLWWPASRPALPAGLASAACRWNSRKAPFSG